MKWGNSEIGIDTTRVITKFAWFPIRIAGYGYYRRVDWRWMERVKIEQLFSSRCNSVLFNMKDIKVYLFGGYWINSKFLDFDIDEKRDNKLKKLGI